MPDGRGSAWTRPRSEKREQPALSRAQIVAQAIRILDAEGLDALSMRRLGTELGAGATSMYTHIAHKDELMERVVDDAFGEVVLPAEPAAGGEADWRDAAARTATSFRTTIVAHPWLASVLGEVGLAYLGPNMMRMLDGLLGLFETAGFAPDAADHATTTLVAYVVGVGSSEAAWLRSLARSGEDEQAWLERLWPMAQAAAEPYPRLRSRYATPHGARQQDRERSFVEGLAIVLDGIAARSGRA